MTTTPTTERNVDLQTIAERLQTDQARKHDLVVPSSNLRVEPSTGRLVVKNGYSDIDLEGVTVSDLFCDFGQVALSQVGNKLGIPGQYLRRLHQDPHLPLFAENINHWLEQDSRSFLVRTFADGDGSGFVRAFLSDRYKVIDDLDVLTAALDGLRSTGIDAKVVGCDLSESRMRVRVQANEVSALAPTLLQGYRTYDGKSGDDNVWWDLLGPDRISDER